MKISSTQGAATLLTSKIYSAGAVLKRNLDQAAIEKQLEDKKSSTDIKEKVSDIERASSKEALQVSNIQVLYEVDGNLAHMDKLAKLASGDLCSTDRKLVAQEYAQYGAKIDRMNKVEDEKLWKDGKIDLNELRKSWRQKLGIDNTDLDTAEDAQKADEALAGDNGAISIIDREIQDLTPFKEKKQDAPTLIDHAQKTDGSTDAQGSAEYLRLLQSCLKSDNTEPIVGGSKDDAQGVKYGNSVLDTEA